MAKKIRFQHLLEKSVHAALSAIEIYNKPDFKYREESFSILMVNSWELILKSRILQENKNNLKSIYVIDQNKTRKDGKPFKHPKFKTSRSGNFLTTDINQNLLKFIAAKEKSYPSDETQEHNISLILETKWVKSKSVDTLTSFKYDPEDPNAISYKVDSEEGFRNKYPWNFTDELKPRLKARYKNFKFDTTYLKLMGKFKKDKKLSDERPLDWNKPTGTKKRFYSTNILKEFDKHYEPK